MIKQAAYGTEPWRLVEKELDLDLLAQSESIFALSNGHLGLRGNLDEGDPHGLPGSYLNSVYEVRPLPYAEAGYGFPDDGQTAINVTNGKLIRLLVDDEPFDIRYGTLHSHDRVLDLRAGTLTRRVDWTSPGGRAGPGHRHRDGVAAPAGHRRHLLHGRAGRRPGPAGGPVRAGGQRAAAGQRAGPARRRGPGGPRWSARSSWPTTTANAGPSWSTAPGSAGCAWRPGCCTRSRARSGCPCTARPIPTCAGS